MFFAERAHMVVVAQRYMPWPEDGSRSSVEGRGRNEIVAMQSVR
jgi:hypothetical protein